MRQKSVGEPGPDSATKAIAFSGCEGAGQLPDRPGASAKLPEIVRQVARAFVVAGETQFLEHSADVRLGQQFLRRRSGQLAPAQKHATGGSNIVAELCQQHSVAQRIFVLGAPRLLRRCRGRRKRQALSPCAGPPRLAADHRIEGADGGAGGERHVLNVFVRKVLRVGDDAAEPDGQCRHRQSRRRARQRRVSSQRRFGPKNHRQEDESRRRFWQSDYAQTAAPENQSPLTTGDSHLAFCFSESLVGRHEALEHW